MKDENELLEKTSFKLLCQHFSGRTQENNECQDKQLHSQNPDMVT